MDIASPFRPVRVRAALALAAMRFPNERLPLIRLLSTGKGDEVYSSLFAVQANPASDYVDAVRSLADSSDPSIRAEALYTLAFLGPCDPPEVERGLGDVYPDARGAAAFAVGRLGLGRLANRLSESRHDSDRAVRSNAAQALVALQDLEHGEQP